ncbi:MAG: methionine gamma-lyase family protein, partial [Bacilli bacterium]|nr:methionine gamma-lyase family protein [Bacilli bacterium]
LFGLLRPGDILLSISGLPYDTLHEVIGIKDNPSSLKSYGIKYDQIDLKDNDFDDDKIVDYLKNNTVKVIEIQRSKGYSTRMSLTIDKLERIISKIKKVSKDTIIMVDNCYCEFVENISPLEVGADIIVGSLIKNLGGGIAQNGGYVAGKKELIHLVSERLNVPGEAKEVGPSLGNNLNIIEGLYHAPHAVASSVKIAILTSFLLEKLGFDVEPKYNEKRADIVQNIMFKDKDLLIKYCDGIQKYSAIDNNANVIPTDMPGYSDQVVMASGSFVSGSSIEISCDGPLREPYIAYQQGSLTYEYGKIAVLNAINNIIK